MKFIIYGDSEHGPNPEAAAQLANEIQASDLLPILVYHVGKLEFEVSGLWV